MERTIETMAYCFEKQWSTVSPSLTFSSRKPAKCSCCFWSYFWHSSSYAQDGSCVPPDFETLTRNLEAEKWNSELKLRNSKLKLQKNFQIFLKTFILKLCLFFKFGVINWFTKQITQFVKRNFQGISGKFYEVPDWSFEVSVLSFILNFEVSDQSFKVRGGGGGEGHPWTVLNVIFFCFLKNRLVPLIFWFFFGKFQARWTQSQKTQGFCVADFATLSDERRSRSKIFDCLYG